MQKEYKNRYKKILMAVVLGIIVGCIALIYNKFLDYIILKIVIFNKIQSFPVQLISIFLPALGGLIVGFFIKYGSITATFIIAEFTHNYAVIIPLLIASLAAERFANLSGVKSVYSPEYFKRLY
ncbi:MAG: hypothetical protein ACQESS_00090 [Bacillota bacterium]